MYNIPESKKQEAKDKQQDDEVFCRELFEQTLEIDNTNIKIQKVTRLGREPQEGQEGRPRPTLLVLENEYQKATTLRNANKLRTETNPIRKRVGIAPDLTRKQREYDYNLRQELKERRAQGETGLYIKNGKLCKASEGSWRRN